MQFTTPTHIAPLQPALRHSDRLLVVGSCFAEHIGSRLQQMKWPAVVNPFGVLYNPLSIAEALGRLMDAKPYTEDDLTLYPHGGWSTWMHHSRYAHPDKGTALQLINESLATGSQMLAQTDMLIITLGTAWVYRLKEDGRVVGNCHKVPEREFQRQRLSVDEIVETFVALLSRLWAVNPGARVLLTVSPVRHLKDTLHGNQLSKSTLLLAVDELCSRYPEQLYYFPAYEVVIDELRDYRFYADDMAHPSSQAVEYVWQRFVEHCTDEASHLFMAEWSKVARALEHRPFRPDSEQYRQFVLQNIEKIKNFKEKYPYLEVQSEIDACYAQCKGCEGNKSVQ